jgi:peptide/nickel transport system permease protein
MQTVDDSTSAAFGATNTALPSTLADDVSRPEEELSGQVRKHRTPAGDAFRSLRRQPLAMAGLLIVMTWLLLGIFAPILPIEDPNHIDTSQKLLAPSWAHPFGTDDLGRDLVSRVIYGARISVPSGIIVIMCTGTIGCLVGAIAGYFRGRLDTVIMRFADAVLSFPSIILAMAITAASPFSDQRLYNALIAVGLVLWPEYARVMRGQVLAISNSEFVTAAEAIGASRFRVLLRHILPSTDAPIIVKATLDVGSAIVLLAGLSFIGLGAVPPNPEWGAMIKAGADKGVEYWWFAAVPGIAIMSVVMALNFFGDGLRDALDPRQRGR